MKRVKPRRYDSPLRQDNARATRLRITLSAAELFASKGYTQTSIDQIAARAKVARPTVYTAFSGKPALLRAAVDLMLAGDDVPVPIRDRPWFQEALRQQDPYVMLQLQARNDRMINERVAPLYEALRNAAATDNDIAQLYATLKQHRHTGARTTVEALAALGPLRDNVDLDTATDLLWTLKDPAMWTALVNDRGWPADRYETWLGHTLQHSLLPPATGAPTRARMGERTGGSRRSRGTEPV